MQGDRDISCSLISAVRAGRLERAKELISSFGLSYSRDWSDGYVLLCVALKNNHTELAKLLLTNGSKVNGINETPSATPLHFAVRNSAIEITEMLLDKGANIDAECEKGATPLHDAVQFEKTVIVELLLNRGASVNAKGKYGKAYLHTAAQQGYVLIVEHLLKHGAEANCVWTGDGNTRWSPLYLAVINGHEKVVKLLLECGANIDAQDLDGKTILHCAVKMGRSLIIEHLLKHSPDMNNATNRSVLNVAVHGYGKEYRKIIENLLEYGFTINLEYGNNCELLHEAVKKEYFGIVEELIKYGVSVDFKDTCGRTALHIASEWTHPEIVKVLLKFGADINSKDRYGGTALHIASEWNNREIVEVLLRFGADVHSKDRDGCTALHVASGKSDPEIVEVLLKFGVNVNSKDEDGRTALHIATDHDELEIIEVLLKFGANVSSKDGDGRTALHLARTGADNKVAIALLDHCSDMTITSEGDYPESFAEICKRHVVKLRTANLDVKNRNLVISSDDGELSDFRNECEKEVATMKSEKIGNISLYDILTKGISELAIYAGNESIVQVFGSDDYKKKIPIYATLINSHFRKGERRKDLMEEGNKIFHFLFTNCLGIPHDCTEKVFNYLRDEDLRSIMDACKPISKSSPNS